MNVTGLSFGDYSIYSTPESTQSGYLWTDSPVISLPTLTWESFTESLKQDYAFTCDENNYCKNKQSCEVLISAMPVLDFELGNSNFSVEPQSYLRTPDKTTDKVACVLMVT